jgi:peroxiredoxin
MMSQSATTSARQEIGMRVEDFPLATLAGQQANLQKFIEGKKGAVVVFWSSVCSHCVRYDGYMNGFAQQHPDIGIVAVACRPAETLDQLRTTVLQRNLSFPILHDANGQVANRWFAQQTPRAYLIDANRVLHYRGAIDNFKFSGEAEYVEYLEPAIKQFLAGEPITRTETASFGCAVQSVYYNLPKAL